MKNIIGALIFIIVIGSLAGVGYFLSKTGASSELKETKVNEITNSVKLVDFSKINSEFLFSAEIPNEFETEYVPNLKIINVYNPNLEGSRNIEKSQLYVSFFKANRFLTLNTVNITRQDKITIDGKEAILYEIAKKDGVPNFSGQPYWRNFKHLAIDIRLTEDNPSYFYSFAQNPSFPEEKFNNFMNSLVFYTFN